LFDIAKLPKEPREKEEKENGKLAKGEDEAEKPLANDIKLIAKTKL
jgi:hypothetical protein